MKRRLRIAAVTAVCLLGVGSACQLFIEHDLSFGKADAQADSGSLDGDVCPSYQPPSGIPVADDAGLDVPYYLMALRTLDVASAQQGFDLDHTCTCCSCGNSGSSCDLPGLLDAACDEDGGVDDAISIFLASNVPTAFQGNVLHEADRLAACGERTMLLALTDYNGLADDPKVFIVAATSLGIRDPHDAGGELDAATADASCSGPPFYYPKWDGTDLWSVPPGATSGGIPTNTPLRGYVSGYRLVVDARCNPGPTPCAQITIGAFGSVPVRFNSPVLNAQLDPYDQYGVPIAFDGGAPVAPPALFGLSDGILAGRIARDDVIESAALAQIIDTSGTTPFCRYGAALGLFDGFKQSACLATDITLESRNDNANMPCDAFSTTFDVTAAPAGIGQTYDGGAGFDPSVCDASQLTCAPP